MCLGVGVSHTTAEFILKLRTFHLHKLLLGIRRIEKKGFRKSFRKRSASAKASAIFRAHSGNRFSEHVASRFATLFPYLINLIERPFFLTALLDWGKKQNAITSMLGVWDV